MSAGSFDAFDSPNLPPLVTMKVKIEGTVVQEKYLSVTMTKILDFFLPLFN